MLAVIKLLPHIAVTNYRTGNQLRKHADVESQVQNIPLRFHFLAVDIHQIGKRVKGVEGNTYRQDNTRIFDGPQSHQTNQVVDVFHRKITVLVNA